MKKYKYPTDKIQIYNWQNTDIQLTKYRYTIDKIQIYKLQEQEAQKSRKK